MTILAKPHNAHWNNSEKTSFDVSIVIPGYTGAIRHTVNIGDRDFPDGALIAWRDIARYAPPALTSKVLASIAEEQRTARVHIAYCGQEKRMSLYGYLGQLNAYATQRKLTDDEALDQETLIAAAEWEQKMLDAVPQLVASASAAALASDESWPKLSADMERRLYELAMVS